MCRVATNVTELNTFLDVMKSREPNIKINRDNINNCLTDFIVGFVESTEGDLDNEKYNKLGKKILKDEQEFEADLFNTKLKFFTKMYNVAVSRYGEEIVNSVMKGNL